MATLTGPLFDGRADVASDSLCQRIETQAATRGRDMVRANLDKVLKHPTGRYRAGIVVERATRTRVSDGGAIYGPWLEGTGSRNRSTRFKGYATFRRTTAQLAREARGVAAPLVAEYVEVMNR